MSLRNRLGSLLLLVVLFQLAATTPTWFTASDGNSYLIEADLQYNWLQAYDLCARENLQLVVIDSAEKDDPLKDLLRTIFANSHSLWIGHHDEFNKDKNTARPFYSVATGNKLNYDNWYPNEPNNMNNIEHCAQIRSSSDFQWNDLDCEYSAAGYICEKPQLSIEYSKDLEQKRMSTYQKNVQISSNYMDTRNEIQFALTNVQRATNDILLGFDNSLDEVIAESQNSFNEIVKRKPYLEAVIADVGGIIKKIFEEAHKGILRISEEHGEAIKHVQVEAENSIGDASDRFGIILDENSNEINEILS